MKRVDKKVEQRAAEWLALREARGFTAAEHAAFAEWCSEPGHAAIFAEVEASWRTFDRLGAYPHSVDVAADPDLLAPPPRLIRWVAFGVPAFAAAAAIAVVWLNGFTLGRAPKAPAPVVAVQPNMQASSRLLRLSDGSEVELNTGSEVTEHFTATERRVRLVRGEAHFTVTKNAERPFIVEAGAAAMRAVGTAFNVRLNSGAVEVLVTEGRVQVTPPANESSGERAPETTDPLLGAGQRIVVPTTVVSTSPVPVVETLTTVAIDHALAWQASRLVFDAMPLAEVVARLNREGHGPARSARLVVPDSKLGALRISGRIRAGNVENFVEVLEANFGILAERRGDEIVLRRR